MVGQVSGPGGASGGPGMFVGQVSVAPPGIKTEPEPVWKGRQRGTAPAGAAHVPADALLQLIQQRLMHISWQKVRNVALVARHFLHQ